MGLGFDVGHLRLEASPAVFEHGGCLRIGLGEQASTLAGDVTLGLADTGCLGGG